MTAMLLPGTEAPLVDVRPRVRIDKADAVAWVHSLPRESVDLFVTDPAYESLEKHRTHGTTVRLQDWFPTFPNELFAPLMLGMWAALKPDTHCYVMCDQETGFYLQALNARMGLFTFWIAIVWDKGTRGMGYHYPNSHEWVLFFEKGKRNLNTNRYRDVQTFKRVRNKYPTEKPVGLMSMLINESSNPGDVVADPFLGSGATAEAALVLGRKAWGCDVSDRALDLSRARAQAIPEAA